MNNADNTINGSLIVIDDLERCGFEQSKLLGVINRYIGHCDARVVLVANTERILDKQLKEFREKVIGQTFNIPPDLKAAVDAFIIEITESAARNILVS